LKNACGAKAVTKTGVSAPEWESGLHVANKSQLAEQALHSIGGLYEVKQLLPHQWMLASFEKGVLVDDISIIQAIFQTTPFGGDYLKWCGPSIFQKSRLRPKRGLGLFARAQFVSRINRRRRHLV